MTAAAVSAAPGVWSGEAARTAALVCLASGAAIGLAFPPFGIWPGIFGFALILKSLDGCQGPRPLRSAFGRGWLAGFSFFLISTWWVGEAFLVDVADHGWQAPFAVGFLAAGLALLWGAASVLYRWVAPRHPGRVLVFAAAFGLLEWLRGHMLTGFPWDLPGEVWRAGGAVSQGASIVGVYGMTFITVAIGAAPGLWRRGGHGGALIAVLAAALTLAGLWAGGAWRLAHGVTSKEPALTLRIVQPDIGQSEKWTPEALGSVVLRYTRLTALNQGRPADVVVWPEGAIPDTVEDLLSPESWTRAAILGALSPGQTLLFGTVSLGGTPEKPLYYNSLVALRRTGSDLVVLGRYDKHHLVPFGEYMPMDRFAEAVGFKALVHIGDGFTPGPPSAALDLPGLGAVQPLICYESLFPGAFDRTGIRPDWIVNISNDAWFGDTSGPWQHLNLASYRSIEEGIPMVRATPTGVSAVVDAYGRPLALLPLGRSGVINAALPPAAPRTLYNRWRDRPFWVFCLIGAGIAAGSARAPGNRGREAERRRRGPGTKS